MVYVESFFMIVRRETEKNFRETEHFILKYIIFIIFLLEIYYFRKKIYNFSYFTVKFSISRKFFFGTHSINNTVKLPKITGFVEGESSASVLSDITEAGLQKLRVQ